MKKLLREPLVHFLLLGGALFALFGAAGKRPDGAAGTIVVTRAQIESLATGFARTWQRRPTASELQGLIDDRVREEVYCREAIALGLDKDDTVIRRRLRQKLEFVSEDLAGDVEPADAELRSYFAAHQDAFRVDPRFTFRHVYLDPSRRRDTLDADAKRMLARLNAPGSRVDPKTLGDPFLLAHDFDAVPQGVVAKQFGDAFADRLGSCAPSRWEGPIASGYGAHLVLVTAHLPGRVPPFEEVREAVRREWADARRLEANEAYYKGLRARYAVTVERDPAAEAGP